MDDRPSIVILADRLSIADLMFVAEACAAQTLYMALPPDQCSSLLAGDGPDPIYLVKQARDRDPVSTTAETIARALAPEMTPGIPASNASGNRRNPSGADALAGSGPGVTPTPDGGEGLPPIPSPPPALVQSSTGSDTVLPRAGGVGDPRHQGVAYYAITGSGAITTVRCPHKHRTEAGARDCANLLAETIDGMVGQVCHRCDTLLAAARDDARRIHRWEPISTTTDYDVDHGPMMCPVCAAPSREELGRDEGHR